MRKSFDYTQKLSCMRLHEQGESLSSISKRMNIPYSTLKSWWRKYKNEGAKGLEVNYDNCGIWKQTRSSYEPIIIRSIRWLKYIHRAWGAAYILNTVSDRYPNLKMPSERTIQTWFVKWDLNKPVLKKYEVKSSFHLPKPKECHETWQVDAKEQIHLKDGTKVCYLTVVDVYSGAILGAPVFSLC